MSALRRLVLIRHGETDGNSSERLIGSGDVDLSPVGHVQMRQAAQRLGGEVIDLVVASPLRRSWRSARLVAGNAPVRLEIDFREIHFGRWEGRSSREIEASDPVRFQEWQSGAEGFEFPGGEPRAEFRARVQRGLQRLLASPARSALLVVHKGVIRVVVEELLGEKLERDRPVLGEALVLTRDARGNWFRGRRSSNPRYADAPG